MGLLEISHPTGWQEKKIIAKKTKDGDIFANGELDQPIDNVPNDVTNGTANGLESSTNDTKEDDFAVLSLRNLLFDICNQNGGGHGGSAIGMAAIGVALFKYVMRYNPSDPEWFDRDRFVLSNGELAFHRQFILHADTG